MKSSLELISLDNENFSDNLKLLSEDVSADNLVDIISNKELLDKHNLNQCIVYNYDSLEFGNIENIKLDIDNIMEARFFNEICELSVYRSDDEFKGVFVRDTGDIENISEDRFIDYRGRAVNKECVKIQVKKYIDYDKDGQAFISYIKPCKFLRRDK